MLLINTSGYLSSSLWFYFKSENRIINLSSATIIFLLRFTNQCEIVAVRKCSTCPQQTTTTSPTPPRPWSTWPTPTSNNHCWTFTRRSSRSPSLLIQSTPLSLETLTVSCSSDCDHLREKQIYVHAFYFSAHFSKSGNQYISTSLLDAYLTLTLEDTIDFINFIMQMASERW